MNSRRSFIVGVTGALVAARALTDTPFTDDLSYTSRTAPRRSASKCRIAKEGSSNVLHVNGISLQVEDHSSGKPALLLHGWPDSSYLWRNQIPFLVANVFQSQYESHALFHDRPFLPWHGHLRAGLVQHGGVNHVSGTFCKGMIRTHRISNLQNAEVH